MIKHSNDNLLTANGESQPKREGKKDPTGHQVLSSLQCPDCQRPLFQLPCGSPAQLSQKQRAICAGRFSDAEIRRRRSNGDFLYFPKGDSKVNSSNSNRENRDERH